MQEGCFTLFSFFFGMDIPTFSTRPRSMLFMQSCFSSECKRQTMMVGTSDVGGRICEG